MTNWRRKTISEACFWILCWINLKCQPPRNKKTQNRHLILILSTQNYTKTVTYTFTSKKVDIVMITVINNSQRTYLSFNASVLEMTSPQFVFRDLQVCCTINNHTYKALHRDMSIYSSMNTRLWINHMFMTPG